MLLKEMKQASLKFRKIKVETRHNLWPTGSRKEIDTVSGTSVTADYPIYLAARPGEWNRIGLDREKGLFSSRFAAKLSTEVVQCGRHLLFFRIGGSPELAMIHSRCSSESGTGIPVPRIRG